MASKSSGAGIWALILLVLILVLWGGGIWAAYEFGEGNFYMDGRTVSELEWWEVAGGVAIGIAGLIIGLAAGVVGLVIGLLAAVLSIALALIGVAAGLFLTAGVILGPFLLIAAIIILIRRTGRSDGGGGASVAEA